MIDWARITEVYYEGVEASLQVGVFILGFWVPVGAIGLVGLIGYRLYVEMREIGKRVK